MIVEVSSTATSFAARKGLPYTEFLDIEVGKLKENGMIKNYLRRDNYYLPCPDQNDSNGVFPIIFEKVILAFSIFFIGVIIALIFMVLEILANFSAFNSLYSFFGPWDAPKGKGVDEAFGHSFKKTGLFERIDHKGPKTLVCKCDYGSNHVRKKMMMRRMSY